MVKCNVMQHRLPFCALCLILACVVYVFMCFALYFHFKRPCLCFMCFCVFICSSDKAPMCFCVFLSGLRRKHLRVLCVLVFFYLLSICLLVSLFNFGMCCYHFHFKRPCLCSMCFCVFLALQTHYLCNCLGV